MKNIFKQETVDEIISRINMLDLKSESKWGKMTVSQMLAHCSVTYEMVYDDIHPKPNMLIRFVLRKLVKPKVVSDKPYSKNGKTAPQFIIREPKDFEQEKKRLIDYIIKTKELGEDYFEGKESLSFGKLSKQEWCNMFYKHLDHHLTQFGV